MSLNPAPDFAALLPSVLVLCVMLALALCGAVVARIGGWWS